MATNSVYVSPGVYSKETDLSFVTASVGVTSLGLVGETLKGPAFSPVPVTSQSDFLTFFGGQSIEKFSNGVPKYELPYIANAYLTQSNQLYVTRVLGLSGYDAGKAWVIKASANIDPTTISNISSTGTTTFTGNTFSNAIINNLVPYFDILPVTVLNSGQTFNVVSGNTLTKTGINFSAQTVAMLIDTLTIQSGQTVGSAHFTLTTTTGTSLSAYENMTLALLRSRGGYSDNSFSPIVTAVTIDNGAVTNPKNSFTLTTSAGNSYLASLDSTSQNYITKTLGVSNTDKKADIFVEDIYSTMFNTLVSQGVIYGISSSLVEIDNLNNYKNTYQSSYTPFFVSEVRGNTVDRLFQFILVSDGNAANSDIKVSIENINFDTREFDVYIRDFNDSDSAVKKLEAFTRCTMNPSLNSYIGKKIGTFNGDYDSQSNYIMTIIDENAPVDALPCGFEGYNVKNYTGTIAPQIQYKTAYNFLVEKVNKAYLGISDIVGIDQNFFNYVGENISTATTQGFHMDSGVTGNFAKGKFAFNSEASVANTDYQQLAARKFAVAPQGGFDGWDIYRSSRTNTDIYRSNQPQFSAFTQSLPSDYYAYQNAINTFASASDVNINVFATPGIDYDRQNALVLDTIEMIEIKRADSLYVVTTPDQPNAGDPANTPTAPQDAVDTLSSAGIDSNYTCTFSPWVLNVDTQNNANIYLPPTYEYLRDLAMTDNKYQPWFATAGFNRGTLQATKARYKVTQDGSDTLYDGRINPIRKFGSSPLMVFGNKTLQVADSALNRINVRRLLLQIEKLVSNVAIRLVFEQDDDTLKTQFLSLVNPILSTVKQQRGVNDFKVICDSSNNNAATADRLELVGTIFIKPTLATEYIILNYNVTDQGASFSDGGTTATV